MKTHKYICKCGKCGYTTTRRKEIRKHIKREHPETWKALRKEKRLARELGQWRHEGTLRSKYIIVTKSGGTLPTWKEIRERGKNE